MAIRDGHEIWLRELRLLLPWARGGVFLLLSSAGLAYWTFFASHDHLVRVLALCGVGLPVASLFLLLALQSGIRRQLAVATSNPLYCGQRLLTCASVLSVELRSPPVDKVSRLTRRGFFHPVKYKLTDPFQLAQFERQIDCRAEVLPALAEPSVPWQLPVEVQAGEEWGAGGRPDGDMLEIGQYHRGDLIKNILWKVVARTGNTKLYVRRPEVTISSRVAYYFVAGPGDDVAAELFDYLLREGKTGDADLYGFSTHPDRTSTSRPEARYLLVESGRAEDVDCGGFEKFQLEVARNQVAVCVLFLPNNALPDAQRLLLESRVRTRGIVCVREGDAISEDWTDQGVETVTIRPLSHA